MIQICDPQKDSKNRARRSIPIQHVHSNKTLVLSEEKYKVSTTQVTFQKEKGKGAQEAEDHNRAVRFPRLMRLLGVKDRPEYYDEGDAESSDSVDVSTVPDPITVCLTQNLSCLITVLLAVMQALLVFLCFCILFFYCQRLRERRRRRRYARQDTVNRANVEFVIRRTADETSQVPSEKTCVDDTT